MGTPERNQEVALKLRISKTCEIADVGADPREIKTGNWTEERTVHDTEQSLRDPRLPQTEQRTHCGIQEANT